jgi:hypothetical protein
LRPCAYWSRLVRGSRGLALGARPGGTGRGRSGCRQAGRLDPLALLGLETGQQALLLGEGLLDPGLALGERPLGLAQARELALGGRLLLVQPVPGRLDVGEHLGLAAADPVERGRPVQEGLGVAVGDQGGQPVGAAAAVGGGDDLAHGGADLVEPGLLLGDLLGGGGGPALDLLEGLLGLPEVLDGGVGLAVQRADGALHLREAGRGLGRGGAGGQQGDGGGGGETGDAQRPRQGGRTGVARAVPSRSWGGHAVGSFFRRPPTG